MEKEGVLEGGYRPAFGNNFSSHEPRGVEEAGHASDVRVEMEISLQAERTVITSRIQGGMGGMTRPP